MKPLPILLIFLTHLAAGQACKEIKLAETPAQQRILEEYLAERKKDCFYKQEIGVLIVTRYTNEAGDKAWDMYQTIDNSFAKNPPGYYTRINDCDFVLVYDDSLPLTHSIEERNKYLTQLLGRKIFQKRTYTRRHALYIEEAEKLPCGPIDYCNYYWPGPEVCQVSISVVFYKDGTHKIFLGV